jgi:uncharacterized protein YbjT (DUF2867 family)
MRVIVFGATGGTGQAMLHALLAGGHQVTAFARDPAAIAGVAGIGIVQGDVTRQSDVSGAVSGHDAVIVSLGNSQNPFAMMVGAKRTTPADVCEVGTRHIIAAMKASGIGRLVVVTAFGIGETRSRLPLMFKIFYRLVLREHMADKERQEALVRESSLDWTIVQPVGLIDGAATGQWLADDTGRIRRQQIRRADVAAFILTLVSGDGSLRKSVSLSG